MKDTQRKNVLEEHITLIKDLGSEYLGYLLFHSGKALIFRYEIKSSHIKY